MSSRVELSRESVEACSGEGLTGRPGALGGGARGAGSCDSGDMTSLVGLARHASRGLAVLVVAVAVIAMHTLGVGHGNAMSASVGGHELGHAPAAMSSHSVDGVVGVIGAPLGTGEPSASTVLAQPSAADCDSGCLGPGGDAVSHVMGSMCLAVLSALFLLIMLWLLQLQVRRSRMAPRQRTRTTAWAPRGPPRRLALSLAQVCVLRT